MKRCLRKVLGNARLTYDELLTVLTEVEATLNSRPLTYDYDNPYEGEVLTPAHLNGIYTCASFAKKSDSTV